MEFKSLSYVVVPVSEMDAIDFSEVKETSIETCRISIDGTQTFVKYDGEMPESISFIENKSQEYTHTEILELLSTEDWVSDTTI